MTTLASLFSGMLTQSATYKPVASRNSDAEEVPGTGTAYACRVERKNKRIVDDQGQVVTSTMQVYLITSDTLTADAVIVYGGETRKVLMVEDYTDELATPYKVIHA